jgi:hypothetical protein
MPADLNTVVDELIEDYNGDVSGIVSSLLVINEQLEIELNRLYKVINNNGGVGMGSRVTPRLPRGRDQASAQVIEKHWSG